MTTYQPQGTRVLLKMLPQQKSDIVLPEGVKPPGEVQRFRIEAIGSLVNQEKFQLEPGSVVQITCPPHAILGVDYSQQLVLVDRMDIGVVVKEEEIVLN